MAGDGPTVSASSSMDFSDSDEADSLPADPVELCRHYGDGFYESGVQYWSAQEPTVSGMLGGLDWTSGPDIAFSKTILERYIRDHHLNTNSCADVACGIGRISTLLLSKYFKRIDLVDPVERFVLQAAAELTALGIDARPHACGAQDWHFEDSFDCFWLQWVLMFLTEDDCLALLRRCKEHLNPNGMIVVKENTILSPKRQDALWWEIDHSFARTLQHICDLCVEAGLRIDFSEQQPDWNPELLPVYCLVLKI
jgi:protein N-terminal methyltransferase